jgi:hypothetical protein
MAFNFVIQAYIMPATEASLLHDCQKGGGGGSESVEVEDTLMCIVSFQISPRIFTLRYICTHAIFLDNLLLVKSTAKNVFFIHIIYSLL